MSTTTATPLVITSNTSKKIRRSPEQWQSIILDYKISGLKQQDFCQQQGVPYSSFTTQLKKQKRKEMDSIVHTETTPTPLFVGIESRHSPSSSSTNWDVELAFANGMVVRLKQS